MITLLPQYSDLQVFLLLCFSMGLSSLCVRGYSKNGKGFFDWLSVMVVNAGYCILLFEFLFRVFRKAGL